MSSRFLWDTAEALRDTAEEMRSLGLDQDIIDMIDKAASDCEDVACSGREAAAA